MPRKKNALEKARSSLKKTEGAYTIKSIKSKLKNPLSKAGDKIKTRRSAKNLSPAK